MVSKELILLMQAWADDKCPWEPLHDELAACGWGFLAWAHLCNTPRCLAASCDLGSMVRGMYDGLSTFPDRLEEQLRNASWHTAHEMASERCAHMPESLKAEHQKWMDVARGKGH